MLRRIPLLGFLALVACQSEQGPTKNADLGESGRALGLGHDMEATADEILRLGTHAKSVHLAGVASALESAADHLVRSAKYTKAVHLLSAAILLQPSDPALYGKRAFALRRSGERRRARADADTARRLTLRALDGRIADTPADVPLRLQRAALRAEAGQLAAALDDGRVALGLAPTDAQVRFALGNLSVYAAAPADALAHYGEALRLEPELGEAYAARGALHRSLGDIARAQLDLDRARALAMRTDTQINDRSGRGPQ